MPFFAKLFAGKSSSFRAKTKRARSRPRSLEALERREQMAANITATWDNFDHVLRIEGTDGVDDITIDNVGGLVSVMGRNINVTNSAYQTSVSALAYSQIKYVEVDALGGNDWVQMRDANTNPIFAVPMIATGGSGTDKLWGGQGADKLYGGWGDDKIGGGGGNDEIYGGYDNYNSGINSSAAYYDRTLGFYATDSVKENQVGLGEKWFKDSQGLNYYIKPDGQIVRSNTNKADGVNLVKLNPSFHTELFSLLNAADIYAPKDMTNLNATYFDATLKLRALDNIWLNFGGKNEKWLLDGTGSWHFVLPNGQMYKQDPTIGGANGTIEFYGTPDYYRDLSKIVDAQDVYWTAGGNDTDTLMGDAGHDQIWGFEGNDTLIGGADNDKMWGGDNNDTLWGASDSVYSYTDGTNGLWGEKGNDNLYGGNRVDTVDGGAGNDGLFGGGGSNTLRGGTEADRFLNWQSELNTFLDQDAGDVVLRFFNSGALDNVAPPANWDTTVDYDFKPGTWTPQEIAAADVAFGTLHTLTNNTKLLKLPNGNPYTFTRRGQQTSGLVYLGQNDGAGNLTVGQGFSSTLALDTLQKTVYHEIGHSWGDTSVNTTFQAFMNLSGWRSQNTSPGSAYSASSGIGDNWWYLTSSTFGHNDARRHPGEDWAITWESYFMELYHGKLMGNTRVQTKYDNLTAFIARMKT